MSKTKHLFLMVIVVLIVLITQAGCSHRATPSTGQTLPPPTETPQPTITPTPTEIPFYVNASVWSPDLKIPIVIYHQFVPDYMNTDATQMRLADFEAELQSYYDAGFSLIALKDWLDGVVVVPDGRKPMVLTIDDLWFGDQIYIRDDGTPSPNSGIGILWQFSQTHPDFGFHAALFAIYGDKYYPEKEVGDHFYAADNIDYMSTSWHIKLGNTIAWAMQHGLEVYNHTFNHWANFIDPKTGALLTDAEIQDQFARNDYWVRQFLTESGNEGLIPQLDNIIALPEGKWPQTQSGIQVVLNYKTPEGDPLLGVMEAYNRDAAQLTPSAFSEGFDRFHIARITASRFMTQYIVDQKDQAPTMLTCQLGPLDEAQAADLAVLQAAIQTAVNNQVCPEGVFNVEGNIFVAKAGAVNLFKQNAYSFQVTP